MIHLFKCIGVYVERQQIYKNPPNRGLMDDPKRTLMITEHSVIHVRGPRIIQHLYLFIFYVFNSKPLRDSYERADAAYSNSDRILVNASLLS